MQPSVFLLPEYRIGPYRMRAVPGDRSTFDYKRKRSNNDWTAGVVEIDQDLEPAGALEWFVRHLVGAIHYRSGLNDSCDEEAYTHSLATGIVELSSQQPFWSEFNRLLAHELSPRAAWGRAAAGLVSEPSAPKRITLGEHACTFRTIPAAMAARTGAYAYYDPGRTPRRIELRDDLHGTNLVLVLLHEVVHFIHHCAGLDDTVKEYPFKRGQALALLRFWKSNPRFWTWWLWHAHQSSKEK